MKDEFMSLFSFGKSKFRSQLKLHKPNVYLKNCSYLLKSSLSDDTHII